MNSRQTFRDGKNNDYDLLFETQPMPSSTQPTYQDIEIDGDYEVSDDDGFETPYNNDENDLFANSMRRKRGHIVYNPNHDHTTFDFVVGMLFENGQQFRQCVQKYGICNGYNIGWKITCETRMEARCMDNCHWSIYIAKKKGDKTY